MERQKSYKLDEASLGRVYQHVTADRNVKSWGMITAYRSSNTPKKNKELNKELGIHLRNKDLGFFKVEGRWRECQDVNVKYADCPDDKLVDSIETTYFVPNISMDLVHELGKKYDQDSVLYGGSETKGNAFLIFRDGSHDDVGKFHPNTIQQAYSKMKGGRTFAFNDKPTKAKDTKPKDVKASTTKLTANLPKDIADKTVRNPQTGRDIKVTSALKYDTKSPVHRAATSLVAMLNKKK
jgi:hypothetical protein